MHVIVQNQAKVYITKLLPKLSARRPELTGIVNQVISNLQLDRYQIDPLDDEIRDRLAWEYGFRVEPSTLRPVQNLHKLVKDDLQYCGSEELPLYYLKDYAVFGDASTAERFRKWLADRGGRPPARHVCIQVLWYIEINDATGLHECRVFYIKATVHGK